MALSQLRPMVIEGDRPAPVAQTGMTKLPDGSLIMRGPPKAAIEQPGMLSGLMQWAKEKLSPAQAQPVDNYWIPKNVPVAPVAAPAPITAAPGTPLPPYSAWGEIEDMVAKEKAIADQLGPVSKKIMDSKQLIEGKWF